MKRAYRTKGASVHWSAAETKSGRRPADKPLVKRGFCSTGLRRISLVRASEESFRTFVSDALEGTRDGFLDEPIRRRPVLPDPARPRHPAVRRPHLTRPRYVRVLDSTI